MDLKDFKRLYKIYSKLPLAREIWDTPEYEGYMHALHHDKICKDWYLLQQIKEAGINAKKYCCTNMAYHMIEDKKEKQELKRDPEYINYDAIITYDKSHKSFGIPIHDGGSSYISIKFCPWCGKSL